MNDPSPATSYTKLLIVQRSQIFAHRGAWLENKKTPNSFESLSIALADGFAVETDVRDRDAALIVSHDPPRKNDTDITEFQKLVSKKNTLAINIKSDGLAPKLVVLQEQIRESNSFVFDCSFPEIYKYRQLGIPHALRISEYESELPWNPDYIWLDSFESDWWIHDKNIRNLVTRIPTIIVSPELHGRDKSQVWDIFLELRESVEHVGICTDYPGQLLEMCNNE